MAPKIRTYHPRRTWTDYRPPLSVMSVPKHPIYIHHDAGAGAAGGADATFQQDASYMRSIESFHRNSRGMVAIAYSFMVMESGRVLEGRGWGKVGAHTEDHNDDGHAICFAGNYMAQRPTDRQLRAARRLILRGRLRRKVAKVWTVLGHRQTKPTACPGDHLMDRIRELRP